MAEIPKVPKDKFEAAIRNLLNTPPTPMSEIRRKRAPKAKRKPAKKRDFSRQEEMLDWVL
jgi:hypothetical protein